MAFQFASNLEIAGHYRDYSKFDEPNLIAIKTIGESESHRYNGIHKYIFHVYERYLCINNIKTWFRTTDLR